MLYFKKNNNLNKYIFGAFGACTIDSFGAFCTGRRPPIIHFEKLHTHHHVSSLVKYLLEFLQSVFMQNPFCIQLQRRIASTHANLHF